jgi:hypothetical protein
MSEKPKFISKRISCYTGQRGDPVFACYLTVLDKGQEKEKKVSPQVWKHTPAEDRTEAHVKEAYLKFQFCKERDRMQLRDVVALNEWRIRTSPSPTWAECLIKVGAPRRNLWAEEI